MPRPMKCRAITEDPEHRAFGPFAAEHSDAEPLEMTFDEFEAIRLADVEGLYQEEAAKRMLVSRQTFGNILASARGKLSQMLVLGRRLNVKGGNIMVSNEERAFGCAACGHRWSVPFGTARPEACPSCSSENIHRMSPGGGFGGGRGGGGRCRGLRTGLQQHAGHGQGRGQGKGQGQGNGQGRLHRNREAGGEE
ncbi:MAG TPA: DUF134 domain-containing protein [Chlorobaculum parvum]|uniref:UPF0251 protein ENL07_00780 n=2 Tax=Chlorobaculum parvum TaxID=274539 RepID=A0A7C5DH56_9CHLB|nr:DUF134 domain-containing protein [Chlorobaculum parvum]